jgi:hypothetical protein
MSQLTDAQERLALYKTAEKTVLEGNQAYTIGTQQYTRANLGQIQSMIRTLEQQIAQLSASGHLSHSQTVFGGRR